MPTPKNPVSKPPVSPAAPRRRRATPENAVPPPTAPPPAYVPPAEPVGSDVLKSGLSRLVAMGQGFLTNTAPGLLDSFERVSHKAIDKTAQGIETFEKKANQVEEKIADKIRQHRKPPR